MAESKEDEIIQQMQREACGGVLPAIWVYNVCYRCRTTFEGQGVSTVCPRCKEKLQELAERARDWPNGNLPPGVDRITKGMPGPSRRVVRIELPGDRGVTRRTLARR